MYVLYLGGTDYSRTLVCKVQYAVTYVVSHIHIDYMVAHTVVPSPLYLVCPDRYRPVSPQQPSEPSTHLVLCYSTVLCDARDQSPAPPVSRGEFSARLLSRWTRVVERHWHDPGGIR